MESICLINEMSETPQDIFRAAGGQIHMSEAIRRGISRYTLYSLLENGVIERASRGVCRLADLPPISNPDLVTAALRYPDAVVCLVSALSYYDLTTQIPHNVSIAVPRQSRVPSLMHPPIVVHRFTRSSFDAGIEEHQNENVMRPYLKAST